MQLSIRVPPARGLILRNPVGTRFAKTRQQFPAELVSADQGYCTTCAVNEYLLPPTELVSVDGRFGG